MPAKLILITGSTGKQGRALISALRPPPGTIAAQEPAHFHVLALTRKADSPIAKQLSLEEHVDVVEGNLDNASSIRKIFEDSKGRGGIWGVFCALSFPGLGANADGEERQGKLVADLALEYGVSSFIYSSVERANESYDDSYTLDRLAKVRIERHVRQLGSKGLQWTILRPGFFMENFEGTIGSILMGVLKAGLEPTTTLQLIAAGDIGNVAVNVFKSPETWASKAVVVVGDICTTNQIEEAYKTAIGRPISSIPRFLAKILIKLNGHTRALLEDIERVHALRVSDSATKENEVPRVDSNEVYVSMTSFGIWAQKRQRKDSSWDGGWNQVTVGNLATGRL